ncbi:hypothetical protein [Streptomyces cremeus]|uniref:Secreted protein n=1 Tax=Streptomyces cremeus TaxID=66881 RepID=A0ABV5PDU9_STRCM
MPRRALVRSFPVSVAALGLAVSAVLVPPVAAAAPPSEVPAASGTGSAASAVDPTPPNIICDSGWDLKPGTYFSTSCRPDGWVPYQEYRAVVHCTNGVAYGPWVVPFDAPRRTVSTARCSGGTRTGWDTQWRRP